MNDGSLQKANKALWLAARRGWIDRLPECLEAVCDSPLSMQRAARHFGLFWSFGHDSFFDANTFLEMMEFDKTGNINGVHFMDARWIPEVKRRLEFERSRRERSNL